MKNYPPEKSLRSDQRNSGRTDVGAVARRGGQPQARKIEKGDTVVLNRAYSGNEKTIIDDRITVRRAAQRDYEDGCVTPIHVSGHASQEELSSSSTWFKPAYFIPVMGVRS